MMLTSFLLGLYQVSINKELNDVLLFLAVDYIVVLPCASLATCSIDDQWRLSKLDQWMDTVGDSMILGHRGNGMTYCLDL